MPTRSAERMEKSAVHPAPWINQEKKDLRFSRDWVHLIQEGNDDSKVDLFCLLGIVLKTTFQEKKTGTGKIS